LGSAGFRKKPSPSEAQPTKKFRSIGQFVLAFISGIQNPRCSPGGAFSKKQQNKTLTVNCTIFKKYFNFHF
jgi:hypothetical protein